MIDIETYIDRLKAKLSEKRGLPKDGVPSEEEIRSEAERLRSKGIPPSIAVTKVFTPLWFKRKRAEAELPRIIKETCLAFNFENYEDALYEDGDNLLDVKYISAWIAVERFNIRPHTVIKDMLHLSNNSMVNHSVGRAKTKMDRSVAFAEKLNQVLINLGLERI